jgi:regulator of replication initiation timing
MDQLDDFEKHVNELVSELSEIIQRLQSDISDAKKAVPFDQVKEIENSIARMERHGIPVPSELKSLKIKLVSEHDHHQALIALHRKIQERIGGLLRRETPSGTRRTRILYSKTGNSFQRKPSTHEKPLGCKGYSNLEDYLIPVIRLMWSGLDHKAAFRKIAQKLDVRYNTVSSQCTRALDLTTDKFIRQVNSKSIVDLLVRKYPDQCQRIKTAIKE